MEELSFKMEVTGYIPNCLENTTDLLNWDAFYPENA